MSTVTLKPDGLYIDDKRFDMLSGDIHYFRIYPGGLRRRLEYAKAFGLNTIQTYCPWNLHEPKKGEFNFSGMLDLKGFLELADEMGFKVLLRPSPYICSEWDFGGLPAWLQHEEMVVRSSDERYFTHARDYTKRICKEFVPYLATNGGPIIAVAVENEYGGYGYDKKYMNDLADVLRECGVDVPLYTTDGYLCDMFERGCIDGGWVGVNYRNESSIAINALRKFQPDKPAFVGEFWSGRAVHWCENFKRRDINEVAAGFKEGLEEGAYMNFYMFAGGTNFGFMNGANFGVTFNAPEGTPTRYIPMLTAYNCDPLLNEEGLPTPKYFACRKALYEFLGKDEPPMPEIDYKSQEVEPISLKKRVSLWDAADYGAAVKSKLPLNMDEMHQDYGYCLYKSVLTGDGKEKVLDLPELRDRADIYLDRKFVATVMRERDHQPIALNLEKGKEYVLELLVENMGRINFGEKIVEKKGLVTPPTLDGEVIENWECLSLPMTEISSLDYKDAADQTGPIFARGQFTAEPNSDTFLDMRDFGKGIAFVNGFNLGRYWSLGPQYTLYIPGELIKESNTVEVFEQYAIPADGKLKTSNCSIYNEE